MKLIAGLIAGLAAGALLGTNLLVDKQAILEKHTKDWVCYNTHCYKTMRKNNGE